VSLLVSTMDDVTKSRKKTLENCHRARPR